MSTGSEDIQGAAYANDEEEVVRFPRGTVQEGIEVNKGSEGGVRWSARSAQRENNKDKQLKIEESLRFF